MIHPPFPIRHPRPIGGEGRGEGLYYSLPQGVLPQIFMRDDVTM